MNSKDRDKELKKFNDTLALFDLNIDRIDEDKKVEARAKRLFRSYMSNGLITKVASLDKDLFEECFKVVKARDLGKYLLDDTLGRKVKKIVYKLFPEVYMKRFK